MATIDLYFDKQKYTIVGETDTKKNELIESSAAIKVKINKYIDILKLNNYDAVVNELSQVNSDIKSLSSSINNALSKICFIIQFTS